MTQTPPTQPPYRQLRRPTTDRMIAGVASGLGRYFNVDPTLVRVLFAALVIFTGGFALLAYPVLWFLMPEEPAGAPAWPHPAATPGWPPAGTYPANVPSAPPASAYPANVPSGPPAGTYPANAPSGPPTSASAPDAPAGASPPDQPTNAG